MYHARITVTLRRSILDPQGKAVEHGIHTLGYTSVENVRVGKLVEMDITATDQNEAERVARESAQKLIANPIMEDFAVEVTKS